MVVMGAGRTVIVCGGRDFDDEGYIWRWLEVFHRSGDGPIAHLIHGGARGADTLAGDWAKAEGCRVSVYPANWRKHGKAAGPIRNQQMLDLSPDAVIAFPGGRGTADMKRRALAAGICLREPCSPTRDTRP